MNKGQVLGAAAGGFLAGPLGGSLGAGLFAGGDLSKIGDTMDLYAARTKARAAGQPIPTFGGGFEPQTGATAGGTAMGGFPTGTATQGGGGSGGSITTGYNPAFTQTNSPGNLAQLMAQWRGQTQQIPINNGGQLPGGQYGQPPVSQTPVSPSMAAKQQYLDQYGQPSTMADYMRIMQYGGGQVSSMPQQLPPVMGW